jgi:hypothetical protein
MPTAQHLPASLRLMYARPRWNALWWSGRGPPTTEWTCKALVQATVTDYCSDLSRGWIITGSLPDTLHVPPKPRQQAGRQTIRFGEDVSISTQTCEFPERLMVASVCAAGGY